jgi:hypothetical protein
MKLVKLLTLFMTICLFSNGGNMAKYKQMEKRIDELEALFDSYVVMAGKSDLLAEHERLCEEFIRHGRIGRVVRPVFYSCLMFLMGFVFAVDLLL